MDQQSFRAFPWALEIRRDNNWIEMYRSKTPEGFTRPCQRGLVNDRIRVRINTGDSLQTILEGGSQEVLNWIKTPAKWSKPPPPIPTIDYAAVYPKSYASEYAEIMASFRTLPQRPACDRSIDPDLS